MQSFYGHLRGGVAKAKAARAATLETRDRHPHPFYWAPFTLVGQ
jgi:CHAT domain-containing protein